MTEHYESCTRDTIGGLVLSFLAQDVDGANLHAMLELAEDLQSRPNHCDCHSRRLKAAEDALRLARKGMRAGRVSPDAVDAVKAERDALKAAS